MYRPSDALKLRKSMDIAIQSAMKEVIGHPIHFKVNSSNIMHTDLQPEGDVFTITYQVEIHKKEEKDDRLDVRSEP